jgi:hypothetical protein
MSGIKSQGQTNMLFVLLDFRPWSIKANSSCNLRLSSLTIQYQSSEKIYHWFNAALVSMPIVAILSVVVLSTVSRIYCSYDEYKRMLFAGGEIYIAPSPPLDWSSNIFVVPVTSSKSLNRCILHISSLYGFIFRTVYFTNAWACWASPLQHDGAGVYEDLGRDAPGNRGWPPGRMLLSLGTSCSSSTSAYGGCCFMVVLEIWMRKRILIFFQNYCFSPKFWLKGHMWHEDVWVLSAYLHEIRIM